MAQSPLTLPPQDQQVETIIRDLNGEEILRVGMRVYTTVLPDGTLQEHKASDAIELVDGLVWNPSFMTRQKDPILVVACSLCRNPPRLMFRTEQPSHGMCSAENAKPCANCGLMCCPKHARRLAQEQDAVYCLKCLPFVKVKSLLKAVFCEGQEKK